MHLPSPLRELCSSLLLEVHLAPSRPLEVRRHASWPISCRAGGMACPPGHSFGSIELESSSVIVENLVSSLNSYC